MNKKNNGDLFIKEDKTINSPYIYPIISVDRNRWFVICLILLIITIIQSVYILEQKDNQINKDIIWVRIFPNSTWDVTFDDVPNQPEFFESTVNKTLSNWVESRYSINPYTITDDYGFVVALMTNELSLEFVEARENGGVGALDVITDAIKCSDDCFIHKTQTRDIQHYDRLSSRVVNAVYRSNVFITEYDLASNRPKSEKTNIDKSIVDVEWRFLSKEEVIRKYPEKSKNQDMLEYLRLNPVLIEILSYEKYKDTEEQ